MEQFRRSDQYYIDEYDRTTIETLRELEKAMNEAKRRFSIDIENLETKKTNTDYLGYRMRYLDTGVHFARNKQSSILATMRSDQRKDHLIRLNPIRPFVKCNTCSELMKFELHDFVGKDSELIFIFSCHKGHLPKKAVYPDGREYYLPKHTCQYCGGRFLTKKKKTKNKLIFTDTCEQCGKIETLELGLSLKKIIPIIEDERKKYCTDFIGRRTFYEDLKAIGDLLPIFDRQDEKIKYNYDQVKRLNVAQLEQTLSKQIEKSDFIKVQFDKPKTGRYLTVEFSAQDPTDREEAKSIKELKKAIETTLFTSNWRLMSPGISYKLGFLNGQLKGYSLEEDLLKIAKEIEAKKIK